jgi:UDP-4-amino-4,6-dideoxy-N-acetyl-beta-L-altrosamine transaminase
MITIPYGKQSIEEDDIEAVVEVLRSDWITQGPKIQEFEELIAEYVGAEYAVAYNSGTSALHGAMYAAGISSGDEVITSPITFVATANSVIYQGGRPTFVDIDRKTGCLDSTLIGQAINKATKVIAPIDFAGYPVDLQPIREIADDHNCIIIEDAAHALGAIRKGRKIGCEADMTMFSFHPVKHITTGEGGIITTNNRRYAEAMRRFRSHGIVKDTSCMRENHGPWYYEMQDIGFNYRITDIQCALGISQINRIEEFIRRRNEIANYYDRIFQDVPGIILPPRPDKTSRHAFHLYPVCITWADRRSVFQKLHSKGIICQVHYIPVHMQPYYQDTFGYSRGDFQVAEQFYDAEISLPMYPALSDDKLRFVAESVIECLEEGNIRSEITHQ